MDHSFDILVKEYRPMVLCYLKSLTGDAHLAEDLAQETFLTAQHAIGNLRESENFAAWLRGIARHKVLDFKRKAARRGLIVDSRIVDGMEEVYVLFDAGNRDGEAWRERVAALNLCVAKLSDSLREAIEVVYRKGASLRVAADQLGISFEAVGQRLSRGRSQVRRCIMLTLGGSH